MRYRGSRNAKGAEDLASPYATVNVRHGGVTYAIPVDEDGHVPRWALAQRFQEAGDFDDLDSDSPVVLPAECTPRELVGWWADPRSCDIKGIDTRDSDIYDVSDVPKSKRHAQRRIAVVAPPEEQARIRRILSDRFTREELEAMAAGGSLVIRTVPDCGDSTGVYYRRQDGIEVPLIVLEEGTTEDGVVHELVHFFCHNLDRFMCNPFTNVVYGKFEWQANEGAAELILPHKFFVEDFHISMQEYGDINKAIKNTAKVYKVNEQVVKYRLMNLQDEFLQYKNM